MKDKKEAKRLYDIEYRRKNRERHLVLKKKYYENNKEKLAAKQKAMRDNDEARRKHALYCAQPEYRKYKHRYDVVRGALNNYGEYWEAAILTKELELVVKKLIPKKERLSYQRNKNTIVARNKRRRLAQALSLIATGDADFKILQRAWKKETRDMLADLLGEKQRRVVSAYPRAGSF